MKEAILGIPFTVQSQSGQTNVAPPPTTIFTGAFVGGPVVNVPVVGAGNIVIDRSAGNFFILAISTGLACTILAPTLGISGPAIATNQDQIFMVFRNGSGGALGAITFNAVYHQPAFVAPANAFQRTYCWRCDGTNYLMQWRSDADVPN